MFVVVGNKLFRIFVVSLLLFALSARPKLWILSTVLEPGDSAREVVFREPHIQDLG